ncbi:MAG: glycoside hydrolase family 3 N-terminal domain-containing protein [Paludibacter sp.]|nr:glycoside hydrolase family 3 N-terminal domain-containing protein [Paludibacter sp.]
MNKPLIFRMLISILIFTSASCTHQPTTAIDKKVEALLSLMTLEEKVGQMAQITLDVIGNGINRHESKDSFAIDTARMHKALVEYHLGSILNTTNNIALTPEKWNEIIELIQNVAINNTRMKIPIIYGVDAIHGTTYTDGAIMFPQQIALAATFNPIHAYNMASVAAYETRASGIPWNFSPVLDLGADPRFSRQFEGFGEDPYLTTIMGVEMIKGYEGISDSVGSSYKVASCLKHFLGYSVPVSGKDRTPAYIPDHVLREYHLTPFKAAIEAGAESVMINSGIINGVSVHASYDLLTKLLKEELGFEGVVVSDWMDIINLHTRDKIASSNKEAIKIAINAGIDMSMIPYEYENFCNDLVALVNDGEVKQSRIDDAVRRILKMKMKLGLWERPVTRIEDYPEFGSEKSAKASYEAAAEAITLLKNIRNILPLSKSTKVLVSGPNANNMRSLNGGWTYSWQGEKTDRFAQKHNTILEAIENEIGKKNVKYVPGVSYVENGKYFEDKEDLFSQAVIAAKTVDVVVLCLGENTYTEKPGDLNDLTMSENQLRLAREMAKTGKPIILVLNQGRPRCISSIEPAMEAIINTYLPGNYGGDALADILVGDVNPSGKLPYTYPSYPNSVTTYYHKPSEEQKRAEGAYIYESDYNPQYEFGFGLSYTTFAYSGLKLSTHALNANNSIYITVNITNTGQRKGKEVVMLYTSDLFASITPDAKRLRRFEKISLEPNETKTVKFNITSKDLAFVNTNGKWITETGDFEISIGNLKSKISYKHK